MGGDLLEGKKYQKFLILITGGAIPNKTIQL
jgi:hypothetical protein